MSFFLECAENFYGQDCSTFCQSRNDASGHYACDPSGGIVCLDGYIGANTSCVQCSPMQGCCTLPNPCIRDNYITQLLSFEADLACNYTIMVIIV